MNSLYCDISGLQKACVSPIGGVAQLFLIRAHHVKYIPPAHSTGHIIVGAVEIKPNTGFLQYHQIADSIRFEEVPEVTPQGLRYRYRISGRYPQLDATVSDEMRKMGGGHFVAIFRDYNGSPVLIGSKDEPLRFQHRAGTDDKRSGKNQYTFELEGTGRNPATFMEAEIAPPNETSDPCSDITNADFDVSWTIAGDNTLTSISVEAAALGNVDTIADYPDGSVYDESGVLIDVLNWSGSAYVPGDGAGVHIVSGTWRFEIADIAFSLVDPEFTDCTFTLTGETTNIVSLTVASISTGDTTICDGETVALSANSPSPIETGFWTGPSGAVFSPTANDPSATVSNLPIGINEIKWTISNGAQLSEDTIDITVNPTPTGQVFEVASISAFGATDGELLIVGLDGSGTGYTYVWDDASTDAHRTGLGAGEYWVIVTDGNSCPSEKIYYTLEEPADPSLELLLLDIKVALQGPYDVISGLMKDNLRTLSDFPLTEPYTGLGYTHVNGGGEIIEASVLETAGNSAVVDWVFVELRDSGDDTNVISTRAALLLRDGSVVDVDGSSSLTIEAAAGSYYIAVRHRNHLGVMTSATHALNTSTATEIDFIDPGGVSVYGTNPMQAALTPVRTLFAGNADGNNQIILAGGSADVNAISLKVFLDPENVDFDATFKVQGYHTEDTNMSGEVILSGGSSDVNVISLTVLLHPGNTTFSSTYIVTEQLP